MQQSVAADVHKSTYNSFFALLYKYPRNKTKKENNNFWDNNSRLVGFFFYYYVLLLTRYDRKGVQNSIPQLWFTIIIKCIILDDVSKSEILVDLTNKIGEKMFTFFVLKYKKKIVKSFFTKQMCKKKCNLTRLFTSE